MVPNVKDFAGGGLTNHLSPSHNLTSTSDLFIQKTVRLRKRMAAVQRRKGDKSGPNLSTIYMGSHLSHTIQFILFLIIRQMPCIKQDTHKSTNLKA